MEKENLNQGMNDSGGASGFNPQSAPQLPCVFSYPTEGGDISVYLAKIGFEKIAVITFDDNHREFTYAVQTLTADPARHVNEIYEMVESAEKEFSNPFISNPFSKLLNDHEAMSELLIVLEKFIESGE